MKRSSVLLLAGLLMAGLAGISVPAFAEISVGGNR